MLPTAAPKKRRIAGRVGVVIILAVLALGLWKHQTIYDQYKLYGYTPPTEIAQLATDATMTSKARHIYYVNHPELKDRSNFTAYCPAGTEQTVVLGCYKGGQHGVYLLQVTNSELQGIQQVTAAHEMLHAAYERLGTSQRQKVDAMLMDYYTNHLTDETIKQTIADYKKSEPNDVVNEMHSIFGTEVADLPVGLEQYYSQYFTNRAKLTGYYAAYQQAFTGRQQQIKDYDAQLSALKTQIDQLETTVSDQQTSLQSQRAALDRSKQSGDDDAYNAGVDGYNSAVNAYNANVRQLQSLIAQYNAIVSSRNGIAFEEQTLVESLSSPAQLQ